MTNAEIIEVLRYLTTCCNGLCHKSDKAKAAIKELESR